MEQVKLLVYGIQDTIFTKNLTIVQELALL